MKTLSQEERAFIDEVRETINDIAAAETECLLNGSFTRFQVVEKLDEEVIRALAATHGIPLPG